MRIQSSALAFWAYAVSSLPLVTANQGLRRKLASNDCTIMAAERLVLEGEDEDEMIIQCEMHPGDADGIEGIFFELDFSGEQKNKMKGLIKNGQVTPGRDSLDIVGKNIEDKRVKFPPGLDVAASVKKNDDDGRRRLAVTKGDKPMLLVKVKDVNGLELSDTHEVMSDEVFGTNGDPGNLKTSLSACSHGQLTVVAGVGDPNELAPGVVEVTIPISLLDNTDSTIRNAVTTALSTDLGISVPGDYQQVMYALEGCYGGGCGWAAYAYINSWNSVYNGNYYKAVGVQVHELGHNFNLAHSGGLNNSTYTDHTGAMGNPHYSDDLYQCFNVAKNFQLDWYDDAKITIDPRVSGYTDTITLVGIAEYDQAGSNPVTVRMSTGGQSPGGGDIFLGFNRATGPNQYNDEGDDLVTIVQVSSGTGTGYSQSYLRAKLGVGESHPLYNFGGTGKTVTVTVNSIDIESSPGTAVVTITDNLTSPPTDAPTTPPPSNAPTPPPTGAPVTAAPTNPPTTTPPSNAPTSPPTNAPTNPVPTRAPTPNPTPVPTIPPTPSPTQVCSAISSRNACNNTSGRCEWSGNRRSGTCGDSGGGGDCSTCSNFTSRKSCRRCGCTWGNKQCSN